MTLSGDPDLFDAALSREAREIALQSVASNSSEFMIVALHCVSQLPSGEYTGELIRKILSERGICPEHPNAWGALTRQAIKAKHLTPTDKWIPMTAVKSHARLTRVYTR